MAIGGTSLAGLVMSVQLFSPSFLVSFGALCCFLLHIHLILSQPRSPLTHASLPSSTTNTQHTTEYKSELSCYMLAPDERYQYDIELWAGSVTMC